MISQNRKWKQVISNINQDTVIRFKMIKKVRILRDEYNKQVKAIHKKHGGQRQSSIHSSNVNDKQKNIIL